MPQKEEERKQIDEGVFIMLLCLCLMLTRRLCLLFPGAHLTTIQHGSCLFLVPFFNWILGFELNWIIVKGLIKTCQLLIYVKLRMMFAPNGQSETTSWLVFSLIRVRLLLWPLNPHFRWESVTGIGVMKYCCLFLVPVTILCFPLSFVSYLSLLRK